jgi:hypothetical protein
MATFTFNDGKRSVRVTARSESLARNMAASKLGSQRGRTFIGKAATGRSASSAGAASSSRSAK